MYINDDGSVVRDGTIAGTVRWISDRRWVKAFSLNKAVVEEIRRLEKLHPDYVSCIWIVI